MADNQQYAALRRRLASERDELQAQLDAQRMSNDEQATDNGVRHHPADEATDVFLREQSLALNNNTADLMAQVDDALARMDAGTYGTCDRCGREIGAERLEAKPYATLCIECQSIVEQERSVGGAPGM